MNRRYVLGVDRVPVMVEVIGAANNEAIEAELRRIYGSTYRLGRWSRRGNRRRAEVKKVNDSDVITQRVTVPVGRNWLGGGP